jgi:predicted tellurium resistance membrane protein TerC
MNWIADPQAWLALATLTSLEVVLGVDNIIFISILVGKLRPEQQARARMVGLVLAMVMRIGLLFSLSWVMRLTNPLFILWGHGISGRDLILLLGGLFLLAKATHEIHDKLEGDAEHLARPVHAAYWSVLTQIVILDMVFSLDSVITAVGMANRISIMVVAVALSVAFMILFAGKISDFVHRHPTIKMLALSFLLLIGVMLIADGFGRHIPKGYIYFAMAFSVLVEMLNLKVRSKTKTAPIRLREPYGQN